MDRSKEIAFASALGGEVSLGGYTYIPSRPTQSRRSRKVDGLGVKSEDGNFEVITGA